MSSADASFGRVAPAAERQGSPSFSVTNLDHWMDAEARWTRLAATADALPFQRAAWLGAWYRHCSGRGVEPLLIFVQDERTGADVLGLPLVRFREGAKRVIAFADRGLTDYNAPAIGAGFADGTDPRALWSAIGRALPAADLLRFEKMPVAVDTRPNPLARMPGAQSSSLIGNILHVPGTWDEWHWGLERTFRKELERSSRVFEKHAGAAFRRYEPGPEAERVYGELKRLQAARIAELSLPYILDDEPARGFYDQLVRQGLRDGTAVLTALSIGEEVVAALLGITDGRHYAMTRLATPDARWKNFSPGRMVIERTMKMLHAEGFRAFDFTIGDYSYKRRIGVTPVPMVEATLALSPLGWPEVARVRARAALKRHPALVEGIRKLRGTKAEASTH